MRRLLLGRLLVAVLFVGASAQAETPPTPWEIARDPGARDRWNLHTEVTQILMAPDAREPGVARIFRAQERARRAMQARIQLELAHAESSPDPRLRFDLGEVYAELERQGQAVKVLRQAVEMAPEHGLTQDAWARLATGYAKLGSVEREREANENLLRVLIHPGRRATALSNLAEADMRAGDLELAISRYKQAILAAEGSWFELALAQWGLAVARDRIGDRHAALEDATRASGNDPGALVVGADPDVFFVPEYERNWYLALGATVHALGDGTLPVERISQIMEMVGIGESRAIPVDGRTIDEIRDVRPKSERWARVIHFWDVYLKDAERAKPPDRWVPLARAHRARAKEEFVRAGGKL